MKRILYIAETENELKKLIVIVGMIFVISLVIGTNSDVMVNSYLSNGEYKIDHRDGIFWIEPWRWWAKLFFDYPLAICTLYFVTSLFYSVLQMVGITRETIDLHPMFAFIYLFLAIFVTGAAILLSSSSWSYVHNIYLVLNS